MKHTWLLAVVVLFNVYAAAQNFGGFPPSTRWRQIDTDTARIIFTKGAQQEAERISSLIHEQAADTAFSLGHRMRKVDIVLQSYTTLANGFVGLAPFRSAFYLVPSSNLFEFGNLPWPENLAIHEYRHVQQYNNFNHDVGKAFYYLFGEQGQAFANALSVPDWFFEGDAVHAETAFTQQGRGRLPFFLSGYNSLWLENKDYSWMKLRNGSMKDYVPDHYQLGYLLTNYGYLKYGSDFWRKVTQDATTFKGLFYPFQKAIKRHAGVDYRIFRKQAFQFYRDQLGKTQSSKRNKRTTVTNYYFPQFISGDSLLYVQTAYDRLPAFYIRDGRGEHRLVQRNITTEDWFSYRNGTIAYTAFSTDPRWSLYDFSDIVLLDVKTGHERRISEKEKMFTPDLSPSGKKLVAIRFTDSLQTELQILQTATGNVEKVLLPGAGNQYANPRFAGEDSVVVVSKNEKSEAALLLIDLRDTATTEILLPYSLNTISVPFVAKDKVYFVSNASGNDDLFSVDLESRKIVQLTQDKTGNYYPSVYGDRMVWSHFTAEGLLLKQASLQTLQQQVISHKSWQQRRQQYPVADAGLLPNAPEHRYTNQPYSNTSHLLNFHSWAPNYVDPEFTFSLYSDNVLNTFSNELFYSYNQNESSHGVGWNSSYGGLFTVINGGVTYTFNRNVKLEDRTLTYDQLDARLGYNIPLNFSKGKSYKFLNFGSDVVFSSYSPKGALKDSVAAGNQSYLKNFVSWSHYLPKAVQHIYPKFGWSTGLQHRQLLSQHGYQLLGNVAVYLPSFANHSLVLAGAFQQTDTNSVVFSNLFSNSRGYREVYFSRMWKAAANYHFPIVYPDFGFANIFYLQRLRGNVFYDFTQVFSRNKLQTDQLRSVGAELFFDSKWWNQLPVSFGFRISHLLDDGFTPQDKQGSNRFEIILPVNLIQQ